MVYTEQTYPGVHEASKKSPTSSGGSDVMYTDVISDARQTDIMADTRQTDIVADFRQTDFMADTRETDTDGRARALSSVLRARLTRGDALTVNVTATSDIVTATDGNMVINDRRREVARQHLGGGMSESTKADWYAGVKAVT
jgi:hypothetical protein